MMISSERLDTDVIKFSKNITGPFSNPYNIWFRKVSIEDENTNEMPGFSLTWKYDKQVDSWAMYLINNKMFTR